MPTIYIDNAPYTIDVKGKNLLEVCLSLGFDLPYFCWHPAMRTVGACRQCAVKLFKDEHDARGRLVMACETPVVEGMRVSLTDPEAVEFHHSIIEWLMVNHPHDCLVCDEGGECHLQDMTVMVGHNYRRARFPKRTYDNQDLGPFVNHEMNRCIQCYRCVRFYNDFAGGKDFGVFGWHDRVYFGRHADGVLESEFSGNLVEVCPTGVFTDKTQWRHYVRKWDLQTAPSICVHCGAGCNTIPGERYGMLRRIRTRYHGQVNGHFLCDRGRYGYEFVNGPQRILTPRARTSAGWQPAAATEIVALLADAVRAGTAFGLGSPRASLEANFALRALVGRERFFTGLSEPQHLLLQRILEILRHGPARTPSQQEIAQADAVLILGEDLHNTAPMLGLAVRQAAFQAPRETLLPALMIAPYSEYPAREAIQQSRSPLFIAAPWITRLDGEATGVYRAAPDDIACFGAAITHALDPAAPAVPDLAEDARRLAETAAGVLAQAARPVIISGCSCGSLAVVEAAANVARALRKAHGRGELSYTVPECNSLGLALMHGMAVHGVVDLLRDGRADTVIVLENDLFHQLDAGTAEAVFAHARQVVVLDHTETATTERATAVLPAAAFAESDGTLVNHEGRAQRFFQVFPPTDGVRESWRWLAEMQVAGGTWPTLDDLLAEMTAALPVFAAVPDIAPPADFRIAGQKIARQSFRNSGRTAITAHLDVREPPTPPDPDTPLAFSMEGYQGPPPPALLPRVWAPGWNSEQALHKFQQEVGGPLRGGDPGRRLIEPDTPDEIRYFTAVPAAFTPRAGEWLILPVYHIFGSEPLSLQAQGIAALAPAPYLLMNAQDAQRRGWQDGQQVELVIAEQARRAPLRTAAWLPPGTAAVPFGLPALHGLALPGWGTIRPAGEGGQAA